VPFLLLAAWSGGDSLPLAAIFTFVGHGTTKKERLQDPAGRKAEKIWRHVQQEALSKKSAIKAAACFLTVL